MRDWSKSKTVFGKNLSDKERYNLKKEQGVCTLPPCRNKAQDGRLTCRDCRIIKKQRQDKWRSENREYSNQQAKKYKKPYSQEREKRGMANWYGSLKSKFGWSKDKVDTVLEQQNYVCAICKQPNNLEDKRLCLDHDHKTNQPREFLCHRCNSTLGYVDDSIPRLVAMIQYLEKHARVEVR